MRTLTKRLGLYHLAGALGGAGLTLWAWSRGAALPGGSLATACIPFVLAWFAGLRLLRGHQGARRLAVVTQALQIPIISLPAITWKCIAGAIASVTLTPKGLALYAGLEATWYVGAGPPGGLPPALGINLVPVVVLILLTRIKVTHGAPVVTMPPAA